MAETKKLTLKDLPAALFGGGLISSSELRDIQERAVSALENGQTASFKLTVKPSDETRLVLLKMAKAGKRKTWSNKPDYRPKRIANH